jgi:abequosyltransferase
MPLLSIAIPTYNRANLLDTCLSKIYEQVDANNKLVEVLVSNNASTDHTKQVVESFRQRYPSLRYFENEKNGGPDFNIARCFELSTSKYVWVFSDDDLLLPNAITNILTLLTGHEVGVVFLKAQFYKDFIGEYVPDYKPFEYELYDDSMVLLAKMHYWTTYISGTITNKELVQDCKSLYRYENSFLIQLGWVLPALMKAKQNAYVSSELILGRALEVLDFKLFHVFGTSYPRVLNSMVAHGELPLAARNLLLDLILDIYFPFYFRPGVKFYHGERPLLILGKSYWRNKKFWNTSVPQLVRRSYSNLSDSMQRPFRQIAEKILRNLYRKGAILAKQGDIADSAKFLKRFGTRSTLPESHVLTNPQCIEIGNRFEAMSTLTIDVHTEIAGNKYSPVVVIGNGVKVGANCRIDCCLGIYIGDLVLIGHNVSIADNELDSSEEVVRDYAPRYRKRKIKGSIHIADNVLIEDGVRIMSGVTIGVNAIIKANAIVHEDVSAYSVVMADLLSQ